MLSCRNIRVGAFVVMLSAWVAASVSAAPFSLVLIPDTQHYADSASNIVNFDAQTQWIVDNQVASNLVFTTHVGDIVENGGEGGGANQVEWDRVVGALDTLHDDLGDPVYSTVPGNHDYDDVNDKSDTSQYIANLGPSRYSAKSWFVGAAPDQVNMAQTFVGDGQTFLHIGLEWLPSDDAIEFAQSVMTSHPTLPVVLTTHQHLEPGNPALWTDDGATQDDTGDNDAEQVYRKLIEPFPQVFMLVSGHVNGIGRRSSTTAMGRNVHELLADFQAEPNGGNGWMQQLEIRAATDEIEVDTFSPTYVPGVTSGQDFSNLLIANYTLAFDMDAFRSALENGVVRHFRQDQDHGFGVYAGAVDTHIGDGDDGGTFPNLSYGGADQLLVDGDDDNEQALIRFAGIFGAAAGQIPPGAVITTAILTLTSEGASSGGAGGALHRLSIPWDANSTWDSLGNGVQLGSEAELVEDANSGNIDKGTQSFDVTPSVQAWADGTLNHGWVLVANGTNDWRIRSSQWVGLVERPMLTVEFIAPAVFVPSATAPAQIVLGLALLGAGVRAATCASASGRHRYFRG